MIAVIFNFEQILDCEYILIQVIDSEKLKSVVSCFENEVVSAHDSLYRINMIIADLTQLLLFFLIPQNQVFIRITQSEPY